MGIVLSIELGVVIAICLIVLCEPQYKKIARDLCICLAGLLAMSLYANFGGWSTASYLVGLVIGFITLALLKASK